MASAYGEELDLYRVSLREFLHRNVEPRLKELALHGVPRSVWHAAGHAGLLGVCIPEAYGGAGDDGLAIVASAEELGGSISGATIGAFMGTDICSLFLAQNGSEEQKQFWFPKILSGDAIQCMGMTEPHGGSDAFQAKTTAIRTGDHYVINGQKCYITNGSSANLLYIVARTGTKGSGSRNLSLIIVPGQTKGLTQRRMKTMGYPGGDVAEIFLSDVRVPVTNLVGEEGSATGLFHGLMAVDRLQLCAWSWAQARYAFSLTLDHVRNRKIFNERLVDFQNTQFSLADAEIDLEVGRVYLDSLIGKFRAGEFGDRDGSICKIWFSNMVVRVVDACLQLWGGHGWMDEMPISRLYTSARLQPIHVGPNELHKSLLGRKYGKL